MLKNSVIVAQGYHDKCGQAKRTEDNDNHPKEYVCNTSAHPVGNGAFGYTFAFTGFLFQNWFVKGNAGQAHAGPNN